MAENKGNKANKVHAEIVAIDKLRPYENNARTHSLEQIEKLRASLREFGFVSPCLIDADYGVIAGHGRLEAAKAEGMTEVPCIFVEHLTEMQKRAYILADNKLAELAGWDYATLGRELDEITIDMVAFGFAEHAEMDIDGMFEEQEPKEKKPQVITCPHCGETFEQ
jgi:ParB-like chromosome segregation protein Spo0J